MKFGFIQIIFLVFVEILCVKSECNTYSGCFQQIYDGFFGSFTNFNGKEAQVGDIEVPGFENVNIESDNVNSILKMVAGFLEELVGDFDLNSQFNVFHGTDNKTSIFVKTVTIADDIEDLDNAVINKDNKTDENNLDGLQKVTSIEQTIDLTTKIPINGITPKTIVNPVLDINELSKRVKENEIIDTGSYDYINDNSTDYPVIDYIDLYKDTTNDYVEMRTTTVSTYEINEIENITTPSHNSFINVNANNTIYTEECMNATGAADTVFPWVTAIFIKNETNDQFDYYCDGALLSDTVIITAASCIQKPNATTEELLVILGKRSLRVMAENEIIAKIKEVHIHDNFTGAEHNLALLVMKVPLTQSNRTEPARLGDGGDDSATTGWAISGELTFISFEEEKNDCNNKLPLNTFCAVYGSDVSVCPSFGGIYVTRQSDDWFLRGIRTDKPMNNGFCVDRTVVYTDLKSYSDWINLYIK